MEDASTIILSASVSVCNTIGLNGSSGSQVGPKETGICTGTGVGAGGLISCGTTAGGLVGIVGM